MNLHNITQPFTEIFPGDLTYNPMQRQTPDVLFSTVHPEDFSAPRLLIFNQKLSEEIGLGTFAPTDLSFLVGSKLPSNIKSYATNYAGHQFGNWAGQLGDGRAIFAGEITNTENKKTEIQWKGAGATPYSRHADGRAVLRSSLREYLMSEAMFHLGVPTTRALSLCLTGEEVMRDMMYDGHPAYEKGAVVVRTAESFLRFGHFELLGSTKNTSVLKQLADYSITNYFPEVDKSAENIYLDWFQSIAQRTAHLIVEWYRVGFVHGVMNTDNMSLLGLSIDYGPFSMLDEYDLNFTPNTTDLPGRRYASGQQAKIAQWNLWQLGNALYPLINDAQAIEQVLNDFGDIFWQAHDEMLCRKFGFDGLREEDSKFLLQWQQTMQDLKVDYTLFFNHLETLGENDIHTHFKNSFYAPLTESGKQVFEDLIKGYQTRISQNTISRAESLKIMQSHNPKFTLRNYLLFECIEEVNNGEYGLLNKIQESLQNPYQEIHPEFSAKRPPKYNDTVGTSMLSCSS